MCFATKITERGEQEGLGDLLPLRHVTGSLKSLLLGRLTEEATVERSERTNGNPVPGYATEHEISYGTAYR